MKKKVKNEYIAQLKREHSDRIAVESGKKMMYFLILVGLTNLALILMEQYDFVNWNIAGLGFRSVMTILCSACILILAYLIKKSYLPLHLKILKAFEFAIHLCLIAMAVFFTVVAYSFENITFSVYLLVIVSAAFVNGRHPYFFGALSIAVFLGMAIYLRMGFSVTPYFADELQSAVLILFINAAWSIFRNTKSWNIYLNENKITKVNEQMAILSQMDELTSIYNRRKVTDELRSAIRTAGKENRLFFVVMIDLDLFKNINDTHGHNAGDNALKEFAALVSANLRKNDVFGRWGGEEFVILIKDGSPEDAFAFVERIRKKVERHSFEQVGNITFSAGICAHTPGSDEDMMIDNADFALYMSKQLGRNKVTLYNS